MVDDGQPQVSFEQTRTVQKFLSNYRHILDGEGNYLKEVQKHREVFKAPALRHDPAGRFNEFIQSLDEVVETGKIKKKELRDGLNILSGLIFETQEDEKKLENSINKAEARYRKRHDIVESKRLTRKQYAVINAKRADLNDEREGVIADIETLACVQGELIGLLKSLGIDTLAPKLGGSGTIQHHR
jgi:flagellar biosynthesis chaperone FliJ